MIKILILLLLTVTYAGLDKGAYQIDGRDKGAYQYEPGETPPCTPPTIVYTPDHHICTLGVVTVINATIGGGTADSVVGVDMPTWATVTKTGENMGRITVEPTDTLAKTAYKLRVYGCSNDSTLCTLRVVVGTPVQHGYMWHARSADRLNVRAAVIASSHGEAVRIPADTATWTDSVTINKRISIYGAGHDKTLLTTTSSMNGGFLYYVGIASDYPIRTSGISFYMTDFTPFYGVRHVSSTAGTHRVKNYMLDRCRFDYGNIQVNAVSVSGVVHRCMFVNGNKCVQYSAGGDSAADFSWLNIVAGADIDTALFVENNLFYDDNNRPSRGNEKIATFHGGKLVVRYNLYDLDAYTTENNTTYPLMTHGSAIEYYRVYGYRRGQSVVEIYNNTINAHRCDVAFILRGSCNLIYNNIVTTNYGNLKLVKAYEEESRVEYLQFEIARTEWPAEDQVTNSFFWNNTLNGDQAAKADVNVPTAEDSVFIQWERDIWLAAPQATGGKTYWTDKKGLSQTHPSDGDPFPTYGSGFFSADSANQFYPYTAYSYPHPLSRQVDSLNTALALSSDSFSIIDTVTWDSGTVYYQLSADNISWSTVDSSVNRPPASRDTVTFNDLTPEATYHRRTIFKGIGYADYILDTLYLGAVTMEAEPGPPCTPPTIAYTPDYHICTVGVVTVIAATIGGGTADSVVGVDMPVWAVVTKTGENMGRITVEPTETLTETAYKLRVYGCSNDSTTCTLLVVEPAPVPPSITGEPEAARVTVGEPATFTLTATGDEPLTYQWYKGPSPVGTNSNSYSITPTRADTNSEIWAIVSNDAGADTSDTVTLSVRVQPRIDSIRPLTSYHSVIGTQKHLSVYGYGFLGTQGTGYVFLGADSIETHLDWHDHKTDIVIPVDATRGNKQVRIVNADTLEVVSPIADSVRVYRPRIVAP